MPVRRVRCSCPARQMRPVQTSRAGQLSRSTQAARPGQADRAGLYPQAAVQRSTENTVLATGDARLPRPLYPAHDPGPRIVIENVQVNTFGTDATVEVRLGVGGRTASGRATGPARRQLPAAALRDWPPPPRSTSCSPPPTIPTARRAASSSTPAAVPFGASQVAVVVLLLSCGGWVEQLAGSAW